jgi:hypothetical protein
MSSKPIGFDHRAVHMFVVCLILPIRCLNSSPFLELSPLAGYELYEDVVPCGGLITGIGKVNG